MNKFISQTPHARNQFASGPPRPESDVDALGRASPWRKRSSANRRKSSGILMVFIMFVIMNVNPLHAYSSVDSLVDPMKVHILDKKEQPELNA
jgi:hypothetical protein